jgi:hypothetical protein
LLEQHIERLGQFGNLQWSAQPSDAISTIRSIGKNILDEWNPQEVRRSLNDRLALTPLSETVTLREELCHDEVSGK